MLPLLAWKMVILAFDADPAGEDAFLEWRAALARYGAKGVRLRPADGVKDWNQLLVSRGEAQMRSAISGAIGMARLDAPILDTGQREEPETVSREAASQSPSGATARQPEAERKEDKNSPSARARRLFNRFASLIRAARRNEFPPREEIVLEDGRTIFNPLCACLLAAGDLEDIIAGRGDGADLPRLERELKAIRTWRKNNFSRSHRTRE
jgi:hypothetical protein